MIHYSSRQFLPHWRLPHVRAVLAAVLFCAWSPFVALADDDSSSDDSSSGAGSRIEIESSKYKAKKDQLKVSGEIDDLDGVQQVMLYDADLGVLLASQSSDEDFNFKLRGFDEQAPPCRVRVEAGGFSAEADVRDAPAQCGAFLATVSGQVVDDPLPDAIVKITVGDQVFLTQADENGFYSVDIVSSVLEQLVLIEASADNPNDPGTTVDLVSIAGTFSKVLSDEEQDVTNLTTASFVLLVEANDGQPIETVEELVQAEKSVDATELLQLAAVIKLIVDDPDFSIPEDENGDPLFDSLVDFVASAEAVDTFIEEVTAADPNDNPLVDVMEEIVTSSDLLPQFKTDKIPDRYYAINASHPGFMSRRGNLFEFNPDNSGFFIGRSLYGGNFDQEFTWSVTDGQLHIDFVTPLVDSVYLGDDIDLTDATPQQVDDYWNCALVYGIDGTATTYRIVFTLLQDGTLVEAVQSDENRIIDYLPIPFDCNDGNGVQHIELADKLEVTSGAVNLRDSTQIVPRPFSEDMVLGTWATYYNYDPLDTVFGALDMGPYFEMVTFEPGGTMTGRFNTGGTIGDSWAIDGDDLVITYASGMVQRTRILDRIDDNVHEYGLFHEFDDGVNPRSAVYDLAVKQDSAFTFSEAYLTNTPGRFWGGMVNHWQADTYWWNPDGSIAFSSQWGWRFVSSSEAYNSWTSDWWDEDGDGLGDDLWEEQSTVWQILPDGRVQLERWGRTRWWIPLAGDVSPEGDRRFYVMEWEYVGSDSRIVPRINLEWELDVPDYEYHFQY